MDFLHRSNHSGLDPLVSEPGTFSGMPLVSHLSGNARRSSGLGQFTTFMQRVREWFLTVHMLAGADGRHGSDGMHVIWRADCDSIDRAGFFFEHDTEVFVATGLRKSLKRAGRALVINVTERDDVGPQPRDGGDITSSHPASTDSRNIQSVVRRDEPGATQDMTRHDHEAQSPRCRLWPRMFYVRCQAVGISDSELVHVRLPFLLECPY